jgi:AraC-like DNA-binding protein
MHEKVKKNSLFGLMTAFRGGERSCLAIYFDMSDSIGIDMRPIGRVTGHTLKAGHVGYYPRIRNKRTETVVHKSISAGICFSSADKFAEVIFGDKLYRCAFPCAFLEIPEIPTRVLTRGEHEIFFISYYPECADTLAALGAEMTPEYWEIKVSGVMRELLSEIIKTAGNIYRKGAADHMDMLCASMFTEIIRSRLSKDDVRPDEERDSIQRVYRAINTRFREDIDLSSLAAENGMALRTLRRRWDKYYPVPMKHFIMLKRIDEAKRLLELGQEPVRKIAELCGFASPYYFSRKFRGMTGVTPSHHRGGTKLLAARAEAPEPGLPHENEGGFSKS